MSYLLCMKFLLDNVVYICGKIDRSEHSKTDLPTSNHTELSQPFPICRSRICPLYYLWHGGTVKNESSLFKAQFLRGKSNGVRGKALDDWKFTFHTQQLDNSLHLCCGKMKGSRKTRDPVTICVPPLEISRVFSS